MIAGLGIGELQHMNGARERRCQSGLAIGALTREGDGIGRCGPRRRQRDVQRAFTLGHESEQRRLEFELQHRGAEGLIALRLENQIGHRRQQTGGIERRMTFQHDP